MLLRAWAHAVSDGVVTTEGMRFVARLCIAPSTHTLRVRGSHFVYYSAPSYGWGDYMAYDYVVVVAAALVSSGGQHWGGGGHEGGIEGDLDLDLSADLKAHWTSGGELDGVPNDSAHRPAMGYRGGVYGGGGHEGGKGGMKGGG